MPTEVFPEGQRVLNRSAHEALAQERAAWKLADKIQAIRQKQAGLDLELGRALVEFSDLKGWVLLGDETFGAFLARPEIGLSRRVAFRLMRVVRELAVPNGTEAQRVSDGDIAAMGITRAEILTQALTPETPQAEVDSLVEDAKALAVSDFSKYVAERNGKVVPDAKAWLEELGFRIIARANRLVEAEAPADLLDEIIAICMDGMARLGKPHGPMDDPAPLAPLLCDCGTELVEVDDSGLFICLSCDVVKPVVVRND